MVVEVMSLLSGFVFQLERRTIIIPRDNGLDADEIDFSLCLFILRYLMPPRITKAVYLYITSTLFSPDMRSIGCYNIIARVIASFEPHLLHLIYLNFLYS